MRNNVPLDLGLYDLVPLGAAVLVGGRAAAEHVDALLHGGAIEPCVHTRTIKTEGKANVVVVTSLLCVERL